MSKDRKKLLHIHSSVFDKQPTPATLELGELGVNNATGNAFISTKNSEGKVVRFSEDDTIVDWMDMKEVFPYEAYVRGISGDAVTGLTEADKLANKSNIVVKLNQVIPAIATGNEYDKKVNGAKDIYNNIVNPIHSEGGEYMYDGAGLAIDMSDYALIGGNPSFSSVSTTNATHLVGSTTVDGDEFNVSTDNVCINGEHTATFGGKNTTNVGKTCDGNISNATNINGNNIVMSARTNINESATNINENAQVITLSATTVNEKSLSSITKTDNFIVSGGNVSLRSYNTSEGDANIDIMEGSVFIDSSNINATSQNNICLTSYDEIRVGGFNSTVVGKTCPDGGDQVSNETSIFGTQTSLYGDSSVSVLGGDILIDSTQNLKDINIKGFDVTETALGNLSTSAHTNLSLTGGENASLTAEDGNVNIESNTGDINMNASNSVLIDADNGSVTINSQDGTCIGSANNFTAGGLVSTEIGTTCLNQLSNTTNVLGKVNTISGSTSTSIIGGDVSIEAVKLAHGELIGGDIGVEGGTINVHGDGMINVTSGKINEKSSLGTDISSEHYIKISGNSDVSITSNGSDDGKVSISANNDGDIVITTKDSGGDIEIYSNKSLDETGERIVIQSYTGSLRPYPHLIDNGLYLESETILDLHSNEINESATTINESATTINENATTINESATTINESATTINNKATNKIYNYSKLIELNSDEEIDLMVDDYTTVELNNDITLTTQDGDITLQTQDGYDDEGSINLDSVNDITLRANDKISISGDVVNIIADASNGDPMIIQSNGGDIVMSSTDSTSGVFIGNDYCEVFIDSNDRLQLTGKKIFIASRDGAEFNPKPETDVFIGSKSDIEVEALGENGITLYTKGGEGDINLNSSDEILISGTNQVAIESSDVIKIENNYSSINVGNGLVLETQDEGVLIKSNDTIVLEASGQSITLDATEDGCVIVTAKDVCMGNASVVAKGFYATSDINMKENIESIPLSDLDRVDNVKFKSFNFKDDETKSKTYGVIAQDVQGVGLRNIVHSNENGIMGVDYTSLLILKLASLERKVNELTNEINEMKKNK